MVKKLLLCFAFGALFGTVSAQVAPMGFSPFVKNSSKVEKKLNVKSPLTSVAANKIMAQSDAVKLSAAQPSGIKKLSSAARADIFETGIWWGYPQSSDGSCYVLGWDSWGQILGMPWSEDTYYNTAILVPQTYAKAIIDSVTFAAFDAQYTNLKVWFAPYKTDSEGYLVLPESPEEAAYCQSIPDVDATGINGLWVDTKLNEGYTIPDEGCFVGISYTSPVGSSPVMSWAVDNYGDDGAYFMQYSYGGQLYWSNFSSYGPGNLSTLVHMDISNTPKTNVSVSGIIETTSMVNEVGYVETSISNEAYVAINNISYVLTVDGVAQNETVYEFSQYLDAKASATIALPYTFTTEGLHSVSVEVTKVDGEANLSSEKSSTGNVIALESAAKRTSVVEQMTGTWCGYCPRGHVAMEKFKEMYGNDVITLSAHLMDTMMCMDYANVFYVYNSSFSAPVALFDRLYMDDPYLAPNAQAAEFGAYQSLEYVKAAYPSEAVITLDADWTDDSKNVLDATVGYTFNYDRMSAPYGIAFVLSEDGMKGRDVADGQMTAKDSLWLQTNYYSGNTEWGNDDDMMPWVSADRYVKTTYDNVIVAAWEALDGIGGCVMAPITKGETLSYTTKLDISSNKLIQDKEKLSLTALLINQNNGSIVNAAQISLGSGSTDGIVSVGKGSSDVTEVARYNANGVRLNAAAKGLNIVKYSDGTTKKVVVK